jgi:hypothetical protein
MATYLSLAGGAAHGRACNTCEGEGGADMAVAVAGSKPTSGFAAVSTASLKSSWKDGSRGGGSVGGLGGGGGRRDASGRADDDEGRRAHPHGRRRVHVDRRPGR